MEKEKTILKSRINRVESRGKYIDSPGVLRKLKRKLRNVEEKEG